MAYEMKIRGTEDEVKIRSPWAAALLPIITLGIYHLVWWYKINRELSEYGKAKGYDLGQNPTNSALALFPGGLIIVPALITYWRGTKRVMQASGLAGKEPLFRHVFPWALEQAKHRYAAPAVDAGDAARTRAEAAWQRAGA